MARFINNYNYFEKTPGDNNNNNEDADFLSQPIGKDKWSQRQIKQYEVEQRMNKKQRKKKKRKNSNQHHEKTETKKRKEEKRKKERLLNVYDRRVQGFYNSDNEDDADDNNNHQNNNNNNNNNSFYNDNNQDDKNITINKDWHAFYKRQEELTKTKKEFKAFIHALSSPLHVTFRIDSSCPIGYVANQLLKSDTYKYKGKFIEVGGKVINKVIEPLSLIENSFKINVDRAGLIRSESLNDLHALITREVKLGHFSRQEEASMLPVCILEQVLETDIRSLPDKTFKVLDMCCCPGSKTKQMLSVLGKKFKGKSCLVANDPDPVRVRTMEKQMERMPFENLIVTCERGEDLSAKLGSNYFDYIYTDVPCTGDGTFRKAPALWSKWHSSNAFAMHRIQVQIALHALSLLKVGGVMLYSTCSLNPIENEAVVTTLIEQSGFQVEFLDAKEYLKDRLHVSPGIKTWIYNAADESYNNNTVGSSSSSSSSSNSNKNSIINNSSNGTVEGITNRTFLSPKERDGISEKKVNQIESMLEKTCRCLPHISNTGGFYIAVIRKTKAFNLNGTTVKDNQSGSKSFEEIDQKASLKILKKRMGFQAHSSSEAIVGDILNDISKIELKIINEKFGMDDTTMSNCFFLTKKDISHRRRNSMDGISSNSGNNTDHTDMGDENIVDGIEDKPFHYVNKMTKDTLNDLKAKQLQIICAGAPVLTRQSPVDFQLMSKSNIDDDGMKISKKDKKRFYRSCEYCFHPDGASLFLKMVNTRKGEISPGDFLSLIELFIHNQDTGIPMDDLEDYVSELCLEYLVNITPGSSMLFYMEPVVFKNDEDSRNSSNSNGNNNNISMPQNGEMSNNFNNGGGGGGGKRRKRRKKKKVQTNMQQASSSIIAKEYHIDANLCKPMTIVVFSMGSSIHLLTSMDRLNSYHQYISSCFR